MAGSHDAVAIAAAVAHNLYIQAVESHIQPDLLIGSEDSKRCDTVAERKKSLLRQPGSNRYHVLLANTHVYEAFLQRSLHVLERTKPQIASEKDESSFVPAKVLDPIGEFFAHDYQPKFQI